MTPGASLTRELRDAIDDPETMLWGGPWEHVGDALRDVRELLGYIARLEAALTEIADTDYRGSQSWESQRAHRALVAEGLRA